MKVYRLARRKYCRDLSGHGASLYPGRWNRAGVAMLYTSTHPAVALLEMLVHIDRTELPDDFCLVTIDIPAEISTTTLPVSKLPRSWNTHPPLSKTQAIGSDFIRKERTHGLYVPCSVLPSALNLLLNPVLCEGVIHVERVDPFRFDERLKDTA